MTLHPLSLRDKFLLSFVGLALALTAMLMLLAGRVAAIVPEISSVHVTRYEAQLLARDIREAVIPSVVQSSVADDHSVIVRVGDAIERYQEQGSLGVSNSVYQALVIQDKRELITRENTALDHLRTIVSDTELSKERNDTAAVTKNLQKLVKETYELENVNQQATAVLDAAERESRRYVMTFAMIAVAIMLLGILIFAQFVSSWITLPLAHVKAAAERIAEGDFSMELTATSHDELGSLVRSFDAMRRHVLSSLEDVENYARRDELLLDSIVDIVIAIDADQSVILFNRSAEAATGWSRLGALHKDIKELISLLNDDVDIGASVIDSVLVKGEAQSTTRPITLRGTKSNRTIPVTMSASPFLDDDGKRGVVIVLRDVTESVELDALRDEFVSITSHQLRTPLTAIRWLLESLLHDSSVKKVALDQKTEMTITQAYDRTLMMSGLVSSLLSLSRLDAQKIKAQLSAVKMDDVLRSVQEEVAPLAEHKQIALTVENQLADRIVSDQVLLREILMNLLTNAIRYSRAGGAVKVRVASDAGRLLVDVRDNGIGIPPDEQKSIFRKFFRAKNAVKHSPEGTGIGLYMVRSFVNLLSGTVSFSSKVDVGTTFSLSLPLTYAHGGA
jgi:PAS domain S-box-containing protein